MRSEDSASARRGLIVIGDSTTLKSDANWNKWLQWVESKQLKASSFVIPDRDPEKIAKANADGGVRQQRQQREQSRVQSSKAADKSERPTSTTEPPQKKLKFAVPTKKE
jgi:hypothetical protein